MLKNIEDVLQCDSLGFCGCGAPKENLTFIRKGLEHIRNDRWDKSNGAEWYKKWSEKGLQIFGNIQSEYFFYYWADKEGYSEHGGSVPGWTTPKGEQLISEIKKLESSPEW